MLSLMETFHGPHLQVNVNDVLCCALRYSSSLTVLYTHVYFKEFCVGDAYSGIFTKIARGNRVYITVY